MLENLEVVLEGERQSIEQQSIYQQLVYAEQSVDVALPEPASPLLKLPENQPHFELKNVTVQYGDKSDFGSFKLGCSAKSKLVD